ncbi:MAG: protein-L-isoaspartate(D-aspartate) O-methyltransferase [Chloroflexota bacterium]
MDDYKHPAQRDRMILEQLITRGIDDPRVLNAMRHVPRHEFLPQRIREVAYKDGALPIGKKQTISQPYIVALMTQLLELDGTEHVLEIGTGSGYQAAILAELADSVISIERHPLLAARSGDVLARLGYENVEVYIGDGTQGMPDMAPYDVIVVTAAAPALPEPLRLQMSPDGGRMVLPIGAQGGQQYLQKIVREGNSWNMEQITGVRFVPLVGSHGFDDGEKPASV